MHKNTSKMSTNRPPRPGSAALQRRRLGRELRSLRRAAGLTQTQVGTVLWRSTATVSRVERGRVGVTPRDVRDMLKLYGVEQQRPELLELALEAHKRDAFWQAYGDVPPEHRTYVELEQSAASIREYESLAVPGCCSPGTTRRRSARQSSPTRPPSASSGTSTCDWPARRCCWTTMLHGSRRYWTRACSTA